MSHKNQIRQNEFLPVMVSDFLKPWNGWFDDRSSFWGSTQTMPAVNISEDKNAYKLSIAAPGMQKEDFKINLEGNMLTISAETKTEKDEEDQKYSRKEYNYSSFSRSFSLPNEVVTDNIQASYKNGVLELELPKNEKTKATAFKQIAVK